MYNIGMINPMTAKYNYLKEIVLSNKFPWFICRNPFDEFDFYAHTFLQRPEVGLRTPIVLSDHFELCQDVFLEILEHNEIDVYTFYRMTANSVSPNPIVKQSVAHKDHDDFYHKNVLIYLNESDGDTICENTRFKNKENDVILFEGKHYHELPTLNRRVVLVATFI